MIRYWLKRSLGSMGYEIARIGWNPYRIKKDFKINTIIDVGIGLGQGTPVLYDAFPEAQLILIDPNPPSSPVIDRILTNRKGVGFKVAAGSERKDVAFMSHSEQPELSKVVADAVPEDGFTEQTVAMLSLDEIVEAAQLPKPFGLKIDVEGFELEVLRGAEHMLADTEFVIIESQVSGHTAHYKQTELFHFLSRFDLELVDIVSVGYERRRNQTIQADLLFSRHRVRDE